MSNFYTFFVRILVGVPDILCGSADLYLCLIVMDPAPTPFFSDFKDAKKKFHIFFLKPTHRHIIFSLLSTA
jgi:hypothetical protein